MKSGIYIITNILDKKVYIGQSVFAKRRLSQHKSDLQRSNRSTPHMKLAVDKHGIENFRFEILCLCDIDDLNFLEIFYIKKYNSTNREYGYNIENGGLLSRIIPHETRMRQSKRKKGMKQPAGAIEIWKKNRSGSGNQRARKVMCTSTGKIWDYAKLAAAENGINYSTLVNKLQGKDRNNTTLVYFDSETSSKSNIPVIDIYTGEKWEDYSDAAKSTGMNPGTLRKYLSGQKKNITNLRIA